MAEKKLDYQFVLEDVWGTDAISQANPLGKVPCLVLEGGEAIFDSRVIVEYMDTRSPVSRLIPESSRERTEVRTWEALADGVLDAAIRRLPWHVWVKATTRHSSLPIMMPRTANCAFARSSWRRANWRPNSGSSPPTMSRARSASLRPADPQQ